jgi:RND family efflux transporter MFP subunit
MNTAALQPKTLWLATSAVALAVALLMAPLGTLAQAPAAPAPVAKPALTVTVEAPTRATWGQALTANGTVTAWQEASVGSQANGLRLTEVRAQVGDRVKAGQVLAVFDAEGVRAELAQTRAALAEAQAVAAEAQANADRARSLQTTGAMSEQQIAQYTTAAVTAAARVASAQALLAVQELRLKHTQVLAPDSGTVSARSATVGAVVPAGTELFRLVRQGRLEWRAEVTAADLARVKPGQGVSLKAASGAEARGRVRTVGPTVDAQTRTALVYVDLPAHTPEAIKPGMFATGQLVLGDSAATTVPQQAVVNRDGFTYVFVLAEGKANAEGTARVQRLKVQAGRRVGDRVELLGGLPAGAPPAIVTQGAGFLNDGDLVKVVATTAAPAAATQAGGKP